MLNTNRVYHRAIKETCFYHRKNSLYLEEEWSLLDLDETYSQRLLTYEKFTEDQKYGDLRRTS